MSCIIFCSQGGNSPSLEVKRCTCTGGIGQWAGFYKRPQTTVGAGGKKARSVLSHLDCMVYVPLFQISNMGHKRHRLHPYASGTERIFIFTLLLSRSLYLTLTFTFFINSEIPHVTLFQPHNNAPLLSNMMYNPFSIHFFRFFLSSSVNIFLVTRTKLWIVSIGTF